MQLLTYSVTFLSLTGLLRSFVGMPLSALAPMAYLPLVFAATMLLPEALLVLADQGPRKAGHYLMGKLWTVAPLYYLFVEQTRAHAFTNTLRWGKADYFVTNRAVSAKHVPFHEIFMSFSRSHFVPAADLLLLLIASYQGDFPPPAAFLLYLVYLFIVALLFTPFLYNPRAFYWPTLAKDLHLWVQWVGGGVSDAKGAAAKWAVWWERGTPKGRAHDGTSLVGQVLMGLVYGYFGARLLLKSNSVWSEAAAYYFDVVDDETGGLGFFATTSLWQLSMGLALWAPALIVVAYDVLAAARSPPFWVRPLLVVVVVGLAVGWVIFVTVVQINPLLPGIAAVTPHGLLPLWGFGSALRHALVLQLLGACAVHVLTVVQPFVPGSVPALDGALRGAVRFLHRTRDYVLSFFLFAFLAALATAVLPNFLQHEIIFQSSPYFVPKTWRSLCARIVIVAAIPLVLLAIFPGDPIAQGLAML